MKNFLFILMIIYTFLFGYSLGLKNFTNTKKVLLQQPIIPQANFSKYQCHYEFNAKGELERTCGWF